MALPPNNSAISEMQRNKSESRRIALYEPDQMDLEEAVVGREVSPGLADFLKNLLRRRKWVRKINIPSGYSDVAAVLVFTTALKEWGLEILSELHVYCAGKTKVEKWEIVGETERIRLMPKESFEAIDITKVRAEEALVTVEFTIPTPCGRSGLHVTVFDFNEEGEEMRIVAHPILGETSVDRSASEV